ncbi:MAG TPA: M28 family peptidase [Herpetosiphonaceae bacterium]
MLHIRPQRWLCLLCLLLVACSSVQPLQPDSATATATQSAAETPVAPSATPEPTEIPVSPSVFPSDVASDPLPTISRMPTPAVPESLLTPVAPLPIADLQFSGERALTIVADQMQWVPRHTGTPGWQQTGDYIIEQARAAGWQVEEQRFEYRGVEGRNIIARRGAGPVLILGAHYDTRKYADRDPDEARRQEPVPGANDGASGVAVLLELARHIDPDRLGREVWLAFFDVEDNGEIDGWEWTVGSRYMAEHLPIKPDAMILVDMIGDADLQIYHETNSTPALRDSIWSTAAELGYTQFIPEPKYAMIDDHVPFLQQGIAAVDLIDFDYPPWHTVGDTADKVSAASLEAVGRTLERWLETRAQP